MSVGEQLAVVVLVAGLLLWLIWIGASRLDRLHRKVLASRQTLDNQLVLRATAAAELAASGLLDPASSVLVGEVAAEALAMHGWDEPGHAREQVETELSATLRGALGDASEVAELRAEPGGHALLEALAAAWYRVQLSRRFHNEAVAQTQRFRRKPLVRALRLAGHAAMPQTVEMDDAWPESLPQPGSAAGDPPPAGPAGE